MKITRLPPADRIANEVISLKPSKGNVIALGKLHNIITGEDAPEMVVRTKRQFRVLHSAVVDAYLNKVNDMKSEMLKRPKYLGASRVELSDMYWRIGRELGVDYGKCSD